MELNVFCKKGKSHDGRTFNIYLTTLKKKTGEELKATIKFRESAGQPDAKDCPCVIKVEKVDANLTVRPIFDTETQEYLVDENGTLKESRTLWVTKWKMVGPYIDHSLDDFE